MPSNHGVSRCQPCVRPPSWPLPSKVPDAASRVKPSRPPQGAPAAPIEQVALAAQDGSWGMCAGSGTSSLVGGMVPPRLASMKLQKAVHRSSKLGTAPLPESSVFHSDNLDDHSWTGLALSISSSSRRHPADRDWTLPGVGCSFSLLSTFCSFFIVFPPGPIGDFPGHAVPPLPELSRTVKVDSTRLAMSTRK